MNILLVSGPGISLKEPYNSGIEAFIVSFANQLYNEGHTVDIIAQDADESCKFTIICPFKKITADQQDESRKMEKDQFQNLDIDSYDVIHYNMFYPHLLEAGSHFGKPSFLTLHSPPDSQRISVYRQLLIAGNLKFVAISKRIKEQWDLALTADIPLIDNGINIEIWPMKELQKQKHLLWSARLTEEKNVTAAISLAQHMQLPLIIAGRIVNQKYFDEQVQPHLNHNIKYVGHVTQHQLSNLSQNAIAFLTTAIWQEPFGLAALEMIASGVPVVGYTTAVPQNWKSESVLTTSSLRWQDLIDLIIKSYTVSPTVCRNFASKMTIQKMTTKYLNLYRDVSKNSTAVESTMTVKNKMA